MDFERGRKPKLFEVRLNMGLRAAGLGSVLLVGLALGFLALILFLPSLLGLDELTGETFDSYWRPRIVKYVCLTLIVLVVVLVAFWRMKTSFNRAGRARLFDDAGAVFRQRTSVTINSTPVSVQDLRSLRVRHDPQGPGDAAYVVEAQDSQGRHHALFKTASREAADAFAAELSKAVERPVEPPF